MSSMTRHHLQSSSNCNNSIWIKRRIKLWFFCCLSFIVWAAYTFFSQTIMIAKTIQKLHTEQQFEQKTNQQLMDLHHQIERFKCPEYMGQLARKKGYYLPEEIPVILGE